MEKTFCCINAIPRDYAKLGQLMLRIDEAMHPLTLLTFGLYGEVLPRQNGAPVRLVVQWKLAIIGMKITETHFYRILEFITVKTWRKHS